MDFRSSNWLLDRPISLKKLHGNWISIHDFKLPAEDIGLLGKKAYNKAIIGQPVIAYSKIKRLNAFFVFKSLANNDDQRLFDLCPLIKFDTGYIKNLLLIYKDDDQYGDLVQEILVSYYGGMNIDWKQVTSQIEAASALSEEGKEDVIQMILSPEMNIILEELKVIDSSTKKLKSAVVVDKIIEARKNEIEKYVEKAYAKESEACIENVLFELENDTKVVKALKHQSTLFYTRDFRTGIKTTFDGKTYEILFHYPPQTFDNDVFVKIRFGIEDDGSESSETFLKAEAITKAVESIGERLLERGIMNILFDKLLEALDVKKEYEANPETFILALHAHLDLKVQQTCKYILQK